MRKTLIRKLHLAQKWRRGGNGEMPSPKEFGLAIDDCIRLLRRLSDEQFNELFMKKTTTPVPITKELLIKNGYIGKSFNEYYDYSKEVDGYLLTFKYLMSNTPERDWYLHVDDSDRCTVAGCDVQYIHQAQQLMEIFDVKLEFEL